MGAQTQGNQKQKTRHEVLQSLRSLPRSSDKPADEELEQKSIKALSMEQLLPILDKLKGNPVFQEYGTYDMIKAVPPSFVVENHVSTDIYGFRYFYDVHTSIADGHAVKSVLCMFLQTTDIVDVVLQYTGDVGEFLFTVEKRKIGGGTLTTTDLKVSDMLSMSSTCSEKSGRHFSVKLDSKYDNKLAMYVGFILHAFTAFSRNRWDSNGDPSGIGDLFWDCYFDLPAFMTYEIGGKPRPPPAKRTYCIVGGCLVNTAHGCKPAKDIRAGDMVQMSDGRLVAVECSITQRINDVIEVCRFGDCLVTPEHPIRMSGDKKWNIPYRIQTVQNMYVQQVNNFVLQCGHHVVVGGNVECITLGHMSDDAVLKHPVWGTRVICDYLQSLPTYPNVVIEGPLKSKFHL